MSFVGTQCAFDTRLLIRVGKLSRDEHLFFRDDLERLGDEVGKRTVHVRLDIAIVFLLQRRVVEVDVEFGVFLRCLHDEHVVSLLPLSNRLVQGDDEGHVHIILLGQQEQPGNIIVLDLVIVLGPPHPQEGIVKLDRVPSPRRQERALVLVELGDDRSARLLDARDLHDVTLQHLRARRRLPVRRIGIGIRRNVEPHGHELIGPRLDRIALHELHLDLVPIVPRQHALRHLAQVERQHLLPVLRFELLSLLVGVLESTLSEDEVLVADVGVPPGIARGGHGVPLERDAVHGVEGLGEDVVVSGGEAVEAHGRGGLLARLDGFGEDADVAGFAEDGPEGAGDDLFGEDSLGLDVVVVVAHDGGFPVHGGRIGGKSTNGMTVQSNVFPYLWLWRIVCHFVLYIFFL
mmetsp:Transcript_33690/g.70824  ORF Transcript_33690/g.70824 Transcript_33690/m.70824 type:complete len:404 (+) Transcript_33690:972-2183(+)